MSTPCIATFHRTSGESLLSEQRARRGASWTDVPTCLPAGTPADTDTPAVTTARLQVAGKPLVYFRGDDALVDNAAFSTLDVVDVTMISTGERRSLGAVTAAARAALGDHGVADLLMQADVVRLYAHVEGTACLVAESVDGGGWRGQFTGEHTYFSSASHHATFGFILEIGADGALSVTGS